MTLYGGKSIDMDPSSSFVTSQKPSGYHYGLMVIKVATYNHLYCGSSYSDTSFNRMRFEIANAEHSRELVTYGSSLNAYFVHSNSKYSTLCNLFYYGKVFPLRNHTID